MKSKLPIIFILIVFLLGVGLLSYPLVSSVINNIDARNSAEDYFVESKSMSDNKINDLFKAADKYNLSLTDNVILTDPFDEKAYAKIGRNYEKVLNHRPDGLICYVEIPKIDVYLPVYHGTDKKVLAKGAGHLENTSFPVGGKSTHSVISAHSAFPGQTFFDYLPDLKKGDEFFIHVLNRDLKYEVDRIKVILPTQVKDMYIESGKDYVTLLTCTPYTINTHRLLVRGKRVPYTDPSDKPSVSSVRAVNVLEDGIFFFGYKFTVPVMAAIVGSVLLVVIILVIVLVRRGRKKRKEDFKHEKTP
ncbi:MAG: class C sortase [Ruminococcus sp.]|nr:class C sortase [Ruminococcus sp.]